MPRIHNVDLPLVVSAKFTSPLTEVELDWLMVYVVTLSPQPSRPQSQAECPTSAALHALALAGFAAWSVTGAGSPGLVTAGAFGSVDLLTTGVFLARGIAFTF